MTDPEEVDGRLAGLIERLRIDGYSGAADCLAAVRSTAYTTRSEWRGDLGLAVREVERQGDSGPEHQADLRWLLARVREEWPAM